MQLVSCNNLWVCVCVSSMCLQKNRKSHTNHCFNANNNNNKNTRKKDNNSRFYRSGVEHNNKLISYLKHRLSVCMSVCSIRIQFFYINQITTIIINKYIHTYNIPIRTICTVIIKITELATNYIHVLLFVSSSPIHMQHSHID